MNEPFNEGRLFLRGCEGDPKAFQEIAARYGKPVYGFLSAFSEVNDARKQQIMIDSLTVGFRTYKPGVSAQPLLVLVLRNIWKTLTQESKQPAHDMAPSSAELHIQWVLQVFGELSREEKALILMRSQMDFLYEEMAAVLAISEKTIKTKLKAAQLRLRELMAEAMKRKYRELRQGPGTNPQLS